MKTLFTIVLVSLFSLGMAQKLKTNFDFEILKDDEAIGWENFTKGDYITTYDTSISQNGKVSAAIESEKTEDGKGFRAIGFTIPVTFKGSKIKLTGYLKTENVEDWAGLWMRVDPEGSLDNMQHRNINGTTDWTKYEIELDINDNSERVVLGGMLSGKGKIWVDNFEFTVDGLPFEKAPKKILSKAKMDKEFDNGSNISASDLNADSVKDLEILGKIWGFLKYHHPEIAKGNYNWDYELFRFLPKYIATKSDSERDKILINWIDSLRTIEECTSCGQVESNPLIRPDLDWIENSGFSLALQNKLKYVRQNRNQGDNYYIGTSFNRGNPDFKHEDSYKNMPYPDAGFRLLALYRYWNIIQYYFPYRHLTDKDWNTVLKEYIPSFISAEDELAYEKVMIKLIGDVKDTHASFLFGRDKFYEEIGKNFPPVAVRFIENQLVITNYHEQSLKKDVGLEIGDIITHINDKPVDEIVRSLTPYYPASNEPTRLRDIAVDILRSKNETLEITIKNDNGVNKKIIPLYKYKDLKGYFRWRRFEKDSISYRMLDNNIGYVTLRNIKTEDVPKLMEKFKNTKGIIIDIRNYPSAFMPFELAPYFVSEDTPFVKFTYASINNPGEFSFKKEVSVPSNRNMYKGKVVVIVNEISQSQAEYTAMSFRAGNNVAIIGSTTAGADGNVSNILLPGGMRTSISGIGVYYPDGTETQRVGIVPDLEIKPTIEGIKKGQDEVLQKAIDLIKSNSKFKKIIKN